MNALQVQNVSHWFGSKRVLHQVNFEISAGQIVAIVGPSGCGKSTLLRAILGTHPPREGRILAEGKRIEHPTRDVGIVYQDYSLYDFLTARDNVAFGLKVDQTGFAYRLFQYPNWRALRKAHRLRAEALLQKVGLGAAVSQYPHEMSGGMRQRVAIAQALIMQPRVLLLDEPFGALDEATREELQLMLLTLYQENCEAKKRNEKPPYTILIVTHELNEALYVADRILGLSQYHQDGRQGATIVYDRAAPVFHPNDPRDFTDFVKQKEALRKVVFDPESNLHYAEYVSFWNDLQAASTEVPTE